MQGAEHRVGDVKIRTLGWAAHILRMEEERIPEKGFKRKFLHHKTSGKTKNQMGGCGPEGKNITSFYGNPKFHKTLLHVSII